MKLTWPSDAPGIFVDRDGDRIDDPPLRVRPGTTLSIQDDDRAQHYLDRGFVRADADGADDDADTADSFDADDFVNRTPVTDVIQDVRDGRADGHLNQVLAAADRKTLRDAIETRIDQVQGGE